MTSVQLREELIVNQSVFLISISRECSVTDHIVLSKADDSDAYRKSEAEICQTAEAA